MKNKIVALSLIINIVLIGIVYNLLNPNERLAEEKQILKEMSTSEREQELDNKITELNSSATEYATYVQSCKVKIANAITEQGVTTNEIDTVDVMVENIKKLSIDENSKFINVGSVGAHRQVSYGSSAYVNCNIDDDAISTCKYVVFQTDMTPSQVYVYTTEYTIGTAPVVSLGNNMYEYECAEGESFIIPKNNGTAAASRANADDLGIRILYCKFLPQKI